MILVCGGAGYIGSHTVLEIINKNYKVVVVDNLETGNKILVNNKAIFLKGDIKNYDFLDNIFKKYKIDVVVHFAAYSIVKESIINPLKYYENNFLATLNLLKAMKNNNINNIVFSSTASVYGQVNKYPILETFETKPTNPYGETKLAIENLLKWFNVSYNIKYIILRYFNVAGAHKNCEIGELHNPETHIIPLTIKASLEEKGEIKIFGNDYETKDGTCIRDYVHVTDVALAHVISIEHLLKKQKSNIYNLGNEKGFSVKEIIDTVKKISNKNFKVTIEKRRKGDPSILIASSKKIKEELFWKPANSTLDNIIKTAFNWHKHIYENKKNTLNI